jgi:hypothetical protein
MRLHGLLSLGLVSLAIMSLLTGCDPGAEPAAQQGTSSETDSTSGDVDDADPAPEVTTTVVIPSPSTTDAPKDTTPAAEDDLGSEVELASIALMSPEGWQRKLPSSSFVAAEFALPAAEGDDSDGRLTISVAGGSVEANIERWKGQFGGSPTEARQEEIEVDGITATMVDFTGEFDDRRGPFAPGTKQPEYRMIAAIIPVDGQLHFIKAVGPKNTMATHADSINEFFRSAQKR